MYIFQYIFKHFCFVLITGGLINILSTVKPNIIALKYFCWDNLISLAVHTHLCSDENVKKLNVKVTYHKYVTLPPMDFAVKKKKKSIKEHHLVVAVSWSGDDVFIYFIFFHLLLFSIFLLHKKEHKRLKKESFETRYNIWGVQSQTKTPWRKFKINNILAS